MLSWTLLNAASGRFCADVNDLPRPLRIAVCAGETSGDQLGAGLVHALKQRFPDAQFAGIAGPLMQAAGVEAWEDADSLAVMGLAEVLSHLPRLLKLRKHFRQRVLDWQPDVYVGIDAPDFNLGVEAWLKARGVRTVHYVSPSVWAWRADRAEKIGDSAHRVLCLFPMEPPIYATYGVDAVFVGHPLADEIPLSTDRTAARRALGVEVERPVLAVLPGSRLSEIEKMLPIFLSAAQRVASQQAGLQVLIPAANSACRARITSILASHPSTDLDVRVFDGQAQAIMIASDVVLLASGTAALEAMLCKRPMVVGHRISGLTYAIVKTFGLLKSEFVSLPNVLANYPWVPELLQAECTPENLAHAVQAWFNDADRRARALATFEQVHHTLRKDASSRAADAITQLITRS